LYYGYCKKCHKVTYFKREQCNVGKGRIGPMAQAIAVHLRYLGMPYRKVAQIDTGPPAKRFLLRKLKKGVYIP